MCILIIKPKGVKMPPLSTLERCAANNPHGCGIATPGKVYKTLSSGMFLSHLQCISDETPALLHFRIATHGSICRENCHPFKDEGTGIAFGHNGVLPIIPLRDMTDSETAFRLYLLPTIKKYGYYSAEFEAVVKDLIGGSKFAFLNREGEIRAFGHFIEYRGCYYSNHSFEERRLYGIL